jgi:hypothetical protein
MPGSNIGAGAAADFAATDTLIVFDQTAPRRANPPSMVRMVPLV